MIQFRGKAAFVLCILSIAMVLWIGSLLTPTLSFQSAFGELSGPVSSDIKIDITSPKNVSGVAGQIIKVEGSITNLSTNAMSGVGYISLVDMQNKIPIDLEDWSAEKGLYIASVAPGQSLPLEWNLRLVKAGSYTVVILFNKENDPLPPIASSKIFLEVIPKHNLNPGNVLPVAFGVPTLLMAILGAINYSRGRKAGVYK
jgi:hypothetical protein